MSHRGRANADELIAAALAAGSTHRDAATRAGVSEKTVFRRAADPAFMTRIAEIRRATASAAAGRLADGMTAAVDTLRALLGSADERVRHAAAVKIIELGTRVIDLAELQAQIDHIEATLNESSQTPLRSNRATRETA